MNINIVITMAGRGSRFLEAGFLIPKYEILAHGQSLFDWSLYSLKNFINEDAKLIFVCLRENNSVEYINFRCKMMGINNVEILELDEITDGQATSAYESRHLWDLDKPLLIYNIDTYVDPSSLAPSSIPDSSDGWIPCFQAPGEHWSFVRVAKDGLVEDVAEKTKISELASIGLYWFRHARLFVLAYDNHFLSKSCLINGERYIAPIYRDLIFAGFKISTLDIDKKDVHVLGTPDELNDFLLLNHESLKRSE